MSDTVAGAIVGSVLAGAIAVGALLYEKRLQRKASDRVARRELVSLLELFAEEILKGFAKCTQYVRQVALSEKSRSKLSTFLGQEQLQRAAQLGAGHEVLRVLHAIYRAFDQVRFQIDKGDDSSFMSILAFVKGDLGTFEQGFRVLSDQLRRFKSGQAWRTKPNTLGRQLATLLLKIGVFKNAQFLPICRMDAVVVSADIGALRAEYFGLVEECKGWILAYELCGKAEMLPVGNLEELVGVAQRCPNEDRGKIILVAVAKDVERAISLSRGSQLLASDVDRRTMFAARIANVDYESQGQFEGRVLCEAQDRVLGALDEMIKRGLVSSESVRGLSKYYRDLLARVL